jgi:hypothetical protein
VSLAANRRQAASYKPNHFIGKTAMIMHEEWQIAVCTKDDRKRHQNKIILEDNSSYCKSE